MAGNRTVGRVFGCIGILIIAAVIGICSGTQWISPVKLAADISADGLSPDERIVLYIRLPLRGLRWQFRERSFSLFWEIRWRRLT